MAKLRLPASTYRLQLHQGFTFADAAAIADYLWALGISHVYSSPYLQAAPGSMHGYDVVDHNRVNEELGGERGHERFSKTLGENGLGQILDIVPNHMAIGSQNRMWMDVLENGSSSKYASFFDIDWQPAEERLRDKVLAPILGDQYGRVLESGDIQVQRLKHHGDHKLTVKAAGQELPCSPESLGVLLARAGEQADSPALIFVAASYARLPSAHPEDWRMAQARARDKAVIDAILRRVCEEDPRLPSCIDQAVSELNVDFDRLDEFLNLQHYRLAYWKTADQQLGYRRFFDVNSLIGLRMERPHVFEETHKLVLGWLEQGVLDGVRVDHPDGLRDPLEYFTRLREHAPRAWILGEKILAAGEYLPENWPIEGTSGYDFLNVALGVLIAPEGMEKLSAIYAEFSGAPASFPPLAHDKKLAVSQEALGSDVNRLASIFVDLCESRRNQRDYTRAEIRRAIREFAACFAVYRSYVTPARQEISDADREVIRAAADCARNGRADIDPGLFDFFHDVLTLKVTGRLEAEFVARFQQFTSPVMAKGVEDTAFYCFNRLTALCEVGGNPGRDGLSLAEFHQYQTTMQATHPLTMTTLSTHDTKRSDDVRARLAVLSEVPEEFGAAITRWSAHNQRFKTNNLPDPNSEYFLYQTLIGAWPIDAERTRAYMQKAMREAKLQTSWVANNQEFESALNGFIDAILADPEFVTDLETFVARVLLPGRINSLAQTLLKHTAPGVPDLYQGAELWDLSLVDPDNRRPVNYPLRRKVLAEAASATPRQLTDALADAADPGLPKLFVITGCLRLRREHPEWFDGNAAYTPLPTAGEHVSHLVAYRRGESIATFAPRATLSLTGGWKDTAISLPEGRWRDLFTGQQHAGGRLLAADVFKDFPIALHVRMDQEEQ